jgi:hypothetical protein
MFGVTCLSLFLSLSCLLCCVCPQSRVCGVRVCVLGACVGREERGVVSAVEGVKEGVRVLGSVVVRVCGGARREEGVVRDMLVLQC